MMLTFKRGKAVTIFTDSGVGVYDDPAADLTPIIDNSVRIYDAVISHLHIRPDECPGVKTAILSYPRPITDYRKIVNVTVHT